MMALLIELIKVDEKNLDINFQMSKVEALTFVICFTIILIY